MLPSTETINNKNNMLLTPVPPLQADAEFSEDDLTRARKFKEGAAKILAGATVVNSWIYALLAVLVFFAVIVCAISVDNPLVIATIIGFSILLGPGLQQSYNGYKKKVREAIGLPNEPTTELNQKNYCSSLLRTGPSTIALMMSGSIFFEQIYSTYIYERKPLVSIGEFDCVVDYFRHSPVQYVAYLLGASLTLLTVVSHTQWLTDSDIRRGVKKMLWSEVTSASLYAINQFITAGWPIIQGLMQEVRAQQAGLPSDIDWSAVAFMIIGAVLIPIKAVGYWSLYQAERDPSLPVVSPELQATHDCLTRSMIRFKPIANGRVMNIINVGWSTWANVAALQQAGDYLKIPNWAIYTMMTILLGSQAFTKLVRYVLASKTYPTATPLNNTHPSEQARLLDFADISEFAYDGTPIA